jgi:mannose-6-phosphate isomerase-like protein (cupin superfamily)
MIKSTNNAEHYTWGTGCDGWHLLKTDTLSVIQERMPPGTGEQTHYHERAQEVAGETLMVNQNQSIHITPNSKHRISNNGKTDLHFLVISEPKSHGDRVDRYNNG